ncbi:hypothetical protein NQZ68_036923 [Dissostichus eleginoides]|nr:hypothetical protein NQZ68_036923 [Dissostichus eleginoides]
MEASLGRLSIVQQKKSVPPPTKVVDQESKSSFLPTNEGFGLKPMIGRVFFPHMMGVDMVPTARNSSEKNGEPATGSRAAKAPRCTWGVKAGQCDPIQQKSYFNSNY